MGSVMRIRMDRSKRQVAELPVWAIVALAVIMIGTLVWVVFG